MKKKLFFCMLFVVLSYFSFAQTSKGVVDMAGLLTPQYIQILDTQVTLFIETHGIDLVLCTTADVAGKTAYEFANDYFNHNGYGIGNENSGVLLLIDMDNREVYISTSGSAVNAVDTREVELILDAMYGPLLDGNFYQAFKAGIEELSRCLTLTQTDSDITFRLPSVKILLILLLISMGIGGIAVFLVVASYRAKSEKDRYPLDTNAVLDVTQRRDVFISKNVVRSKVQRNSSSDGGRHSGGGNHGGGGRSF